MPRSWQNAVTLCPLALCSDTKLRHFAHNSAPRSLMSTKLLIRAQRTKWGLDIAHSISPEMWEQSQRILAANLSEIVFGEPDLRHAFSGQGQGDHGVVAAEQNL